MDASNNDQPAEKPPALGKNPRAWAVFFVVVLVALAADLGLKVWSFDHVAQTPIRLQTAEQGGPEVLVPSPTTGEWVSAYDTGLTPDRARIPPHPGRVVLPGLLDFRLTLNQGAVFGSAQGGRPIFIAVTVIAVVVIVVLVYRSPVQARAYRVGLALILGGAIGNLYDRVRFSAVRDMLHMLPGTKLWPWIFNPADVALVCGVALVLVVSYLGERQRAAASKRP